MKRIQIFGVFLLGIMIFSMLAGCSAKVFTKEDEIVNNVNINNQGSLKLDVLDGDIKVTFWQEDYLKIVEKRSVRGPGKREKLKELLDENKYVVETTDYSVSVRSPEEPEKNDSKGGKSIFSLTDDMEIMVPQSIYNITIKAGNGDISISGHKLASFVDVGLKNGSISIDKLEAGKISVNAAKGDIYISEITGNGEFKCGRGKIAVKGMAGNIEAKLTQGEINIEEAEGRFNCDISSGKINLRRSWLLKDSIFYASSGEIKADFEVRDEDGTVKFMAAKGDILLNLPKESGWSLMAKSTKGRVVVDKQEPKLEELKKSPSGEVYGDAGGGGPFIDAYVDNGKIYLQSD